VTSISVQQVSVDLPVFNGIQRSLKHRLLNAGTGGRISRDGSNHIVVEALRDVSFEIADGDRVALIGRNGAGKSTLLRLIAGICEPTHGRIEVEGRVSALFNGSLFIDPEMTGYENISYIASILGIDRKRLRALREEVADFTELGDYLHMPVRTYSAGMQLKLSFAMATSIDPEILVLDEALAAGDVHFIGKSKHRGAGLLTRANIVVIASHDAAMLRSICRTAIWLDRGRLIRAGAVDEVLQAYEAGELSVPDAAQ
jgi:ABC-type polysaccharide/polyol phosphate transport system ATPase subunit